MLLNNGPDVGGLLEPGCAEEFAMHDFDTLMSPPKGDQITVTGQDGSRLRCIVAGDGPPVVLAHGFVSNLTCFNLVFGDLAGRGHRVIAFDQRGHGASTLGAEGFGSRIMAGDYRAVLEHFDVRNGILLGHSMGAFLSIVLALEHPAVVRDRLGGMILLGGHAGAVAKGSRQNRLQIPMIRWGVLKTLLRSRRLGHRLARSLFGREVDSVLLEVVRASTFAGLQEDTALILEAQVREDFYPRLGDVGIDTVVLCGDLDKTCPRWHSERLGEEIPSARNVWLPNVGHMVPYEAPDAVIREIDALSMH